MYQHVYRIAYLFHVYTIPSPDINPGNQFSSGFMSTHVYIYITYYTYVDIHFSDHKPISSFRLENRFDSFLTVRFCT